MDNIVLVRIVLSVVVGLLYGIFSQKWWGINPTNWQWWVLLILICFITSSLFDLVGLRRM